MDKITIAALFATALLLPPATASAETADLPPTAAAQTSASAAPEQTVVATGALIREIQFMLLNVGIDPGPIDGTARQLTNHAVHTFQQRSGLPIMDIANERPVSQAFINRLRQEAAQTLLKGAAPQPAQSATAVAAPPPTETATAAPPRAPPAPAPDRFASCAYNAADFLVGGKQYTPQSFLDEGFGGATPHAITNLQQRLEEARQIAEKIGGPALGEVQRQARVLAYFECRQRIEQSSTVKN
jgi:peptidoglycan hydrolase-like protein with peptidoglycan-binding domain